MQELNNIIWILIGESSNHSVLSEDSSQLHGLLAQCSVNIVAVAPALFFKPILFAHFTNNL